MAGQHFTVIPAERMHTERLLNQDSILSSISNIFNWSHIIVDIDVRIAVLLHMFYCLHCFLELFKQIQSDRAF